MEYVKKSCSQLFLSDDPPRLTEHRVLQQLFLQHETRNPNYRLAQIHGMIYRVRIHTIFTSSPKGRLISEDSLEEKVANSKRNAKAV